MLGKFKMTKPPRQRLFALYAAILFTAVGLVASEALVRILFRYNTPDTVRENSLQYLPSVFTRHRLAPNQTVRTEEAWGPRSQHDDDAPTYQISELGYRGRALAVEKPAGTCRVFVLGGSAVFDIK